MIFYFFSVHSLLQNYPVENILVMRFSSLGDIVLLSFVFEKIKKQSSQNKIYFLTHERFAHVLEGNPYIDKILFLPNNIRKNRKKQKDFLYNLKKYKFKTIYDFHNSFRSRWFRKKLRLKQTAVFILQKYYFSRFLLTRLHIKKKITWLHQREKYNQVLQQSGLSNKLLPSSLYPSAQDQKELSKKIPSSWRFQKAIAIAAGSAWALKKWPLYFFIDLVRMFTATGFRIILLGAANEKEAEQIEKKVNSPLLLNLSGKLTVLQTALVLKKCRIAIGNDSAIIHIAEAMSTPAIAIMGPTSQELGFSPFLPESMVAEDFYYPCRPCTTTGKGKCRHNNGEAACLQKVFPVKIYQMVTNILK